MVETLFYAWNGKIHNLPDIYNLCQIVNTGTPSQNRPAAENHYDKRYKKALSMAGKSAQTQIMRYSNSIKHGSPGSIVSDYQKR
jgi:hypothetical protein